MDYTNSAGTQAFMGNMNNNVSALMNGQSGMGRNR